MAATWSGLHANAPQTASHLVFPVSSFATWLVGAARPHDVPRPSRLPADLRKGGTDPDPRSGPAAPAMPGWQKMKRGIPSGDAVWVRLRAGPDQVAAIAQ